MSAEDLRLLQTQIETIRGDSGFDYVVGGARPHADRDRERRYIETMAEGGATYGRQEFVANRMSQNGVSDQMAPGFRPAIVCRRRVPTHTVPRLVAQVALTLISVTTLCGCSPASNSRWRESPHVQMEAAPDLAVLSASNRLQRFSIASHVDKWKAELGGGMQSFFTAHLLAPAHDSRQVVVLVRGVNSDVTLVDWASGRVLQRRHLPGGLAYRGLDVGRVSGRIYVFANREVGPDRGPDKGPPSDAVVVVLGPGLTTVSESQTVRRSAGFNWLVYRGGLDSSERHLLLSYHGPDTTGVDVIDVTDAGLLKNACPDPNRACVQSHGGFVSDGSSIFFTTGSSLMIETDESGRLIKMMDTGIENEHLMEVATDGYGLQLLIPGSCLYSGGLFEFDVGLEKTTVIAKQRSTVCGERAIGLPGSVIAVVGPDILLVDRQSGAAKYRQAHMENAAVDVLVLTQVAG